MTDHELKELHDRLKYAVANGFQVARMEFYAAELAELGAEEPEALSPQALLDMAESVLSGEAKKGKKKAPKADKPADPPPAPEPSSEAAAEPPATAEAAPEASDAKEPKAESKGKKGKAKDEH